MADAACCPAAREIPEKAGRNSMRTRSGSTEKNKNTFQKGTKGEGIAMNPKKEQDYADVIPDEEQEVPAYEQTYRDGSLQNECWAGGNYQSKNSEREYDDRL